MTATARVALGDASLVKDWYLDIDTAYPSTAAWVPVSGIVSFKPSTPAVFKDSGTFDGGGWGSQQKTGGSWEIDLSLKRAPQSSALTAYDVGAEKLRVAGALFGGSNRVHVRWYEVNGSGFPVTEAWEGYAAVEWSEKNEGLEDIRVVDVKLKGQGPRTAVSPNPGSV